MSTILIIAEQHDGNIKKYSLELASKAFELGRQRALTSRLWSFRTRPSMRRRRLALTELKK
jgi:hypothetical protein